MKGSIKIKQNKRKPKNNNREDMPKFRTGKKKEAFVRRVSRCGE